MKGTNNLFLLVQALLERDIFIRMALTEGKRETNFNENYSSLGKKRLQTGVVKRTIIGARLLVKFCG